MMMMIMKMYLYKNIALVFGIIIKHVPNYIAISLLGRVGRVGAMCVCVCVCVCVCGSEEAVFQGEVYTAPACQGGWRGGGGWMLAA